MRTLFSTTILIALLFSVRATADDILIENPPVIHLDSPAVVTTTEISPPLSDDKPLIDDLPPDIPHTVHQPVMMWEIQRDGKSAFIIGSLHMATESIYPLPGSMMRAFDESRIVVFEVDPQTMDATFKERFQQAGRADAGEKLLDLLSSDVAEKFKAAAYRNHIPISLIDNMKPWMAAVMLAANELMSGGTNGVSPRFGLDQYFTAEAEKHGKEMRGLESGEDQLKLFTTMSDQLSLEFLEQTLDELSIAQSFMSKIVALWRLGDNTGIWRMIEKEFEDFPAVYDQWLVARNQAWVVEIEKLIHEDARAFIVVGSAHVVGPDGLPELLRARGYEVNQQYHE